MPRPKMPPTPASSTEIKGQDHSNKLSSLQLTFELPPSAITPSGEASKSSTSGPKMSPVSPTSTRPYLQPSETVKARRRSTATQQKETFALPPPPTRSRKIIQMKPCPQDEGAATPAPTKGASSTASGSQTRHAAGSGVAAASGSKTTTTTTKKQPSATSAAGRKIARKTAHSLIERRRRSKMNEEFAVLKGLIPACTGEMHKLAILQVSYYLSNPSDLRRSFRSFIPLTHIHTTHTSITYRLSRLKLSFFSSFFPPPKSQEAHNRAY